jgi:serine O-acetyltransferase
VDIESRIDVFQNVARDLLGKPSEEAHRCRLPQGSEIQELISRLIQLLFPRSHYNKVESESGLRLSVPRSLSTVYEGLTRQIQSALQYREKCPLADLEEDAQGVAMALIEALPSIQNILECDLEEVLKHDPAAVAREEVLLSYPGVEALTVHRLAHFLHKKDIPLIPRMMSEMVHSRTGIDIHPAAQIAPYCSIDHGTGLIIGETTIIGEHVNLFHNVTLGAKSVTPEFRGKKRHPTIGNHVIIYPGATILGDIEVGDNTVIGGNAFLLESCPANSKIYAKPPEMIVHTKS